MALGDDGQAAPARRKVAVLDFVVSGVSDEQKSTISSSLSAVVAAEVAAQGHDVVSLEDIVPGRDRARYLDPF